jgi:hypothetical protein
MRFGFGQFHTAKLETSMVKLRTNIGNALNSVSGFNLTSDKDLKPEIGHAGG